MRRAGGERGGSGTPLRLNVPIGFDPNRRNLFSSPLLISGKKERNHGRVTVNIDPSTCILAANRWQGDGDHRLSAPSFSLGLSLKRSLFRHSGLVQQLS